MNKPTVAPAVRQPAYVQLLDQSRAQIEMALPKVLKSDRFIRVALTEIRKSKHLQECNPMSLVSVVMQAAQLGLEFGAVLGHAYMIPYKGEATLQIGYKGLIALARRSGEIRKIEARAVYEGDDFKYWYGLTPGLEHVPMNTSNEVTFVYAVALLADGTTQFDVMTRREVEDVRDNYSRARDKDAWVKSFDEMAKKTIIRRLMKLLPISTELANALEMEGPLEKEAERPDPKRLQRVMDSQMSLSAGEEESAQKDYTEALADAQKLGLDVEKYKGCSESLDQIGATYAIREEIQAWKSKTESKP